MYLLLQSSLDMDGIVLEIKDLTAIKFPVFYLNILPRNDGSIISDSKKAYRYNSISEKIAFFIKNVLWYSTSQF